MATKEEIHLQFRESIAEANYCKKCKCILNPPRTRYCRPCAIKVNPNFGAGKFKSKDKPCENCKIMISMHHPLQKYCKPCAKKVQSIRATQLSRRRDEDGRRRAFQIMEAIQNPETISNTMLEASISIKNYVTSKDIHNPGFSQKMLENMITHHKINPYINTRFEAINQKEPESFNPGYARCPACKSPNCMTAKVKEKIDNNICMNCGMYYQEDYTSNRLHRKILMRPFRINKKGEVQD